MSNSASTNEFSKQTSKNNAGQSPAAKNTASRTYHLIHLLIWARKQRGPYYDPTTRMYHVDRNSRRYFSGYTLEDAEAENLSVASGQKNLHDTTTSVSIEKEVINLHHPNRHISPPRPSRHASPSGGRRPGRPK
ncbi:hypothetical protein G9A89_011633 [Geosiphon pyriformis]|nr:hypothetical protein G9A89_011633 [Geosiphon pyriformis]